MSKDFYRMEIKRMLYFFINPASRSGRGLLQWKKTEKYLKQNKIPYEAHILKDSISPRPVMETIFEKEEGIISIVLIGGDGTINQCVKSNLSDGSQWYSFPIIRYFRYWSSGCFGNSICEKSVWTF